MSTPAWQPATQYLNGAIVAPRSNNVVVTEQPYNNSFEDGLTHWTVTGVACTNSQAINNTISSTSEAYDGTQSVEVQPFGGDGTYPIPHGSYPVALVLLTNSFMAPVKPGDVINFEARFWRNETNVADSFNSGGCRIAWFDDTHTLISYSYATNPPFGIDNGGEGLYSGNQQVWIAVGGKGTAPAGAAYAAAVIAMTTTAYSGQEIYADYFTWDYTAQGYPTGLVFVAVQTGSGTSAANEPVWPVEAGQTVQDGSVTWEAEYASAITWTAGSILKSGSAQPTWPTQIGGSVLDGSIEWTCHDGRITDTNCPNSKIVAIASAKVYAADDDIIRFSATASAQDWSSSLDAGYIPFGLQSFGNEPCAGLGLYRSNLVAFNSLGYQMWQVDPDPSNIALLDAEPVGCTFPKSIQPVNNDLVFLSPNGIRNIGTAGAAGNTQAGQFGKQVDPIVLALMRQLATDGYEVKSLFNPGTGQYFLFFGPQAIVLSINGNNSMSWSRYLFPEVITDWTVLDGVLYMRAGDLVWEFSDQALLDDQNNSSQGGNNVPFDGLMMWNYIECGALGLDKMMEGFDITIGNIDDEGLVVNNDVSVTVTIGYSQSNRELATDPFTVTGDSIPGTMIPMPLTAPSFQMRLDFGSGQNWGWGALNLYVKPLGKP